MIGIGIISRWHVHAGGYVQQFKNIDGVKVVSVWDEDAAKGKEFADKFDIPFEADLDKLLANNEVHAVCINAPTSDHGRVILKAINAGKHVFTEKVLALTLDECLKIKEALADKKVKFCISYPHRGFSHNLFAKQLVDENLLGTITYLRIRNAHDGASRGWLPPHFYDKKACGGGAMIDLGAHPMYLIGWLLGKPSEISSAFTHVTGKEVEDNAVSVMKYKSGAIAVYETGFVSGNSPYVLEMYGTEGSLIINGKDIKLISAKSKNEGSTFGGWITPSVLPKPLPDPIDQFVDGVLHGKEIVYGIDDAVLLTEIMEAAYKSHESGEFVKVNS